jgi:hypothetical protein
MIMTLKFLIYQKEYDDWFQENYEYEATPERKEIWDKQCLVAAHREGPDCLDYRRQKYIIEGDTPEQAIRKKRKK